MLRQHLDITKDYATELALALLQSVGIPEAERRLNEYPHQMSGGMRQRVVIAIAIACGPKLLFADEPTTALDVTVQAQILDLLQEQQRERFMAMILVTHDLGVVAGRADDIAVMYAGRIVEKAPTRTLFGAVRHPYTEALLRSIPKLAQASHTRLTAIGGRPPDIVNPPSGCKFSPRCPYVQTRCTQEEPPLIDATEAGHAFRCWIPVGTPESRAALESNQQAGVASAMALGGRLMAGSGTAHLRSADETLLRIEDLVVEFPVGRTGLKVHAVSNVSIDVLPGETLGLVGESGCGKSTMGKAVMQLVHAQVRSVQLRRQRPHQPLRQPAPRDPSQAPDDLPGPDLLAEPSPRVARHRAGGTRHLEDRRQGNRAPRSVDEVLDTVGIDPTVAGPKRPHEFSGGQCQRISIARAVATEPKLIICDEPVSALDVSVQAQILNLLEDMKRKYGLTLIFIAHDLAVVKNVSDKVAVMYLGKLCEFAQPDELYASPAHPYTAALLSAIPEPDPELDIQARAGVGGEIPSPLSPPSGCRFRTRCPAATQECAEVEPLMREVRAGSLRRLPPPARRHHRDRAAASGGHGGRRGHPDTGACAAATCSPGSRATSPASAAATCPGRGFADHAPGPGPRSLVAQLDGHAAPATDRGRPLGERRRRVDRARASPTNRRLDARARADACTRSSGSPSSAAPAASTTSPCSADRGHGRRRAGAGARSRTGRCRRAGTDRDRPRRHGTRHAAARSVQGRIDPPRVALRLSPGARSAGRSGPRHLVIP